MWRRNQQCGFVLLAFGAGMLFCGFFESGFLCKCIAIGIIFAGFFFLKKK